MPVGRSLGSGWGSRDRRTYEPADGCRANWEKSTRPPRAVRRYSRRRWVMALRPGYTPHNHWECVKQVPNNKQTLNLQIIPLLSDVNHWTIYLNVTSTPAKYFVFYKGEFLRRESVLNSRAVSHSKDVLHHCNVVYFYTDKQIIFVINCIWICTCISFTIMLRKSMYLFNRPVFF